MVATHKNTIVCIDIKHAEIAANCIFRVEYCPQSWAGVLCWSGNWGRLKGKQCKTQDTRKLGFPIGEYPEGILIIRCASLLRASQLSCCNVHHELEGAPRAVDDLERGSRWLGRSFSQHRPHRAYCMPRSMFSPATELPRKAEDHVPQPNNRPN